MTALSLLRLLPDGVAHTGGTVKLDGVELFGLREREMRDVRGGKMAMIFQEPGLSLNPVLTVVNRSLRCWRCMQVGIHPDAELPN